MTDLDTVLGDFYPPDAVPAVPRKLSEADFMRQVTELAELLGWGWAHFRPAQTAKGWRTPVSGPLGAGWPDLVLVREKDRRLIFAELKADKGRVSPVQNDVLVTLARLQIDEDTCTCGLRRGIDFAHDAECAYTYDNFGSVQVFVFRPSGFDTIVKILT